MTVDEVKQALPANLRSTANLKCAEEIVSIASDKEVGEAFRENFISYTYILTKGKNWSVKQYINAVKFISYKLLGRSDIDAWSFTFPERYQKFIDDGLTRQQIAVYANSFKQSKLVMKIFEQTIIPSYILNAPLHQDAINVLADIMNNTKYTGMTRVKAAEVILNYTKPPETHKVKLEISNEDVNALNDLRKATEELAKEQLKALKTGLSLTEIAEQNIIDAEIEELPKELSNA
jgi:hypothetical protein